jgi:heme-degrading monooxygenase HmoA
VVRIYQESVLPAAKEQRGFRGALMLTGPDTGEGVSISLWESANDMYASEASGFYHRKLEELDAFYKHARAQALRGKRADVAHSSAGKDT